MSKNADNEIRDELDQRTDGHGDTGPATIRLPRRRHLSPWSSRRLVLAIVVVLLLVPLWLDPSTLREFGNMTPSPVVPNGPSPAATTPEARPPASAEAPGGPAVLVARDNFGRVVDHGWGSADLGGGYSATAEGFAALSVESGRATTQVGPEGAGWAVLSDAEARDTEVLVSLGFQGSTEGQVSAGAVLRAIEDAMYSVRVLSSAGSTGLIIELTAAGPGNEDKLLAGPQPLPDVDLAPGRVIRLRAQTQGSDPTTIRARAWLLGNPEPAAWQISVVDWTGRLQHEGGVGLSWNVERAVPSGTDIAFDNLVAWSSDRENAP